MHRSVLEDAEFIAWASDNVVVLVAHKPTSHKKFDVAKPAKGEPKSVCSVYPGMTCDEHNQIFKDLVKEPATKDEKDKKPTAKKKAEAKDALPLVDMAGFPSSFLISPSGTIEKHGGDRAPASCRSGIEAFQAKYDENPVPVSKWDDVKAAFGDAEKAFTSSKWKAALDALVKMEAAVGGKLPKAWVEKEKAKIDAINAKVVARFAEIKRGKDADAVKTAVKALHDDVAVTLAAGALPVVADLDAFLAGGPAPAPGGPSGG